MTAHRNGHRAFFANALFALALPLATWIALSLPAHAVDTGTLDPALAAHCNRCHGPSAARENWELHWYVPNFHGQQYAYLVRQLEQFSAAKKDFTTRSHATMDFHARSMTESEIEEIAAYYAAAKCLLDVSENTKGLQNRCAKCHGAHGISTEPGVPNLAGQKYDYMVNQLKSFRNARRGLGGENLGTHRISEEMGKVVEAITPEEVQSLLYYASLQCR